MDHACTLSNSPGSPAGVHIPAASGGAPHTAGPLPAGCGNTIGRQPQNGGHGIGCQPGLSYTLTTADRHVVSAPAIAMRMRSGCSGGGKGNAVHPFIRHAFPGGASAIPACLRSVSSSKEATDGRYPRFALWENVPGALSSAGGRDFKAVHFREMSLRDGNTVRHDFACPQRPNPVKRCGVRESPYAAHCHLPGDVILRPCLRRSQRAKFQCLVPGNGQTPAKSISPAPRPPKSVTRNTRLRRCAVPKYWASYTHQARRLGLADGRSGLFSEAVRVIYEMKEATDGRYPRFALWENVPGAKK